MANKKNAPVKRKYTKKSTPPTDVQKPEPDNKELFGFILDGIDRLSLNDKAQVFAHIIGKNNLSDHQIWAVEKILS